MKIKLQKLKRLSKLARPLVFSVLFEVGGADKIVFAQSWNQVLKTVSSKRSYNGEFGSSVSISGDYAIVGANNETHNVTGGDSLYRAGAAYILKNIAGTWTLVQKIVASDREVGDMFGVSVSISGDYAIVGAKLEDHNATGGDSIFNSGSAYIFKNTAGTWKQLQKIVASDRTVHDAFGNSVSISGNFAIVGALSQDYNSKGRDSLFSAGSAYIFENTEGSWSQVKKIVASDRAADDEFGYSVAISGNYAIVGVRKEDHNAEGGNFLKSAGSAYIFKNTAGTWFQVKKIVASDRAAFDYFGQSVSISGDYAIVGASGESHNATGGNFLDGAGSAYIFKNTAGTWSQVQKIVATDRGAGDHFGESVSISGDFLIVGAFVEDPNLPIGNFLDGAGSAYIFKNTAGSWSQMQKIMASDRIPNDLFGASVSISGAYAIVGAVFNDFNATGGEFLTNAGSAYIYKNYIPSVGILENSFRTGLFVYPNPTKGNFSIDLGSIYENIQISITDINGKLIESKTVVPSQVLNLSIVEPAGVYLLSVQSGNKKALVRLLKE